MCDNKGSDTQINNTAQNYIWTDNPFIIYIILYI